MKEISLIALQGRNEIQAIRCAALVLFLIGAAYADDPPPPPIPPKPLPWSIPMRRLQPRHLCPFHQRLLQLLAWLLMCLRRLRCRSISFRLSTRSGCRTRMVGQSTSGLGLAGGIEVEFPAGGCANAWTARSPSSFRSPPAGLAEPPLRARLVARIESGELISPVSARPEGVVQ